MKNNSTTAEIKSVAVFCGSSFGNSPSYLKGAEELGAGIASLGLHLVFGGGHVGLMGAVSAAALKAGGKVTGVLPARLSHMVTPTPGIELLEVDTMHTRKQKMYDLSDAAIALPGGIGTIEEIFEVCTWNQLGYFNKAVCFYNINSYYDKLERFLENMIDEGFYKQSHFNQILFSDSIDKLLEHVRFFKPEYIHKLG